MLKPGLSDTPGECIWFALMQ